MIYSYSHHSYLSWIGCLYMSQLLCPIIYHYSHRPYLIWIGILCMSQQLCSMLHLYSHQSYLIWIGILYMSQLLCSLICYYSRHSHLLWRGYTYMSHMIYFISSFQPHLCHFMGTHVHIVLICAINWLITIDIKHILLSFYASHHSHLLWRGYFYMSRLIAFALSFPTYLWNLIGTLVNIVYFCEYICFFIIAIMHSFVFHVYAANWTQSSKK